MYKGASLNRTAQVLGEWKEIYMDYLQSGQISGIGLGDQKKHITYSWKHKIDLGRVHKLVPVPLPDGWILKLADCPERGEHILHRGLQVDEGIPRPHLLVQQTNILGKLFALDIHVLHIDLPPWRRFPVVDACLDNVDVVPELLSGYRNNQED